MSAAEIIAEVPKLDHLFEWESDAQMFADADRRANENAPLLDALETEDARNKSG